VTEQHWNEFLEKLDFAQLTTRWGLLPMHWLDQEPPPGLDAPARALYDGLSRLPLDLEAEQREEQIRSLVRLYRQARSAVVVSMEPSLTPPGSRITLRYLNPEDLGQGDCLITVGSWDRLGHFIAEQAGLSDEMAEPSENPVRKDPGQLSYRHLLIFPDKGTPSPRAFRALCEKTLRQARGLGARRLAVTHLHLPQPGLPDRFAAAEVVSAVRQMLREGGGISVELLPLTVANYEDYRHWFASLTELSRGQTESAGSPPAAAEPEPSEPLLANALRGLAQKTSSLAQEAGRGVSSWLRSASTPSPVPATTQRKSQVGLEPSFEDHQALNLLYLGRWREAEAYRHRWQQDSLLSLYMAALYKVVRYLDQHPVTLPETPQPEARPVAKKKAKAKKKGKDEPSASEPEPAAEAQPSAEAQPTDQANSPQPDPEYLQLRESLLATAQELGVENPLARYFQLLAWRLDERLPDIDPDRLEEDHARLLRAAWAWDDAALLAFLRSARQDRESGQPKPPGYVPVFPSGSRPAPRIS
jgi:hypothetical protein